MLLFCAIVSVRGIFYSMFDPFYNIGVIISFVLGNYLSCLDQAKMQLIIPIISLLIFFILPESPEFLAKKNKITVRYH